LGQEETINPDDDGGSKKIIAFCDIDININDHMEALYSISASPPP
jgi:hypothetical protein